MDETEYYGHPRLDEVYERLRDIERVLEQSDQ